MDGFDHYPTASIPEKWTAQVGAGVISAGNGRRGGQCYRATGSTVQTISKTIDAQASWVVGFGFKYGVVGGASMILLTFLDAGTPQCDLRLNTDGTVSVTRAGTSVTSGTSVTALSASVYYYIEMKVTIADSISAGSCKVRLNGVDIITVATGQDLKATANATANQVKLGPTSITGTYTNWDWDDLYVCDGTDSGVSGNACNDLLGDVAVVPIYATGAGNYTAWSPDSGSNYARVNELVADGDTSFVDTGSAGNIDSYAMQSVTGSPSTIYAVGWNVEARKTDASVYKLRRHFRAGGTDYVGSTDYSLSTTYAIYQEVLHADPATSAAWTSSNLTTPEFGVKLNSVA
jgi:hypothetical protein